MDEPVPGRDYWVYTVPMQTNVHGLTVMDECGFYSIYINSLYPISTQLRALRHELTHIKRGDFLRKQS